jgi:hypothetical protein
MVLVVQSAQDRCRDESMTCMIAQPSIQMWTVRAWRVAGISATKRPEELSEQSPAADLVGLCRF